MQRFTSGSIGVETDLKRISKRFETCNNFEHDRNVFSAVSQPSESPGIDTCYEEGETGLIVNTGGTASIRF